MKKIIAIFLIIIYFGTFFFPLQVEARKISESARIFKQVKDGVVTIFTSVGHGSGFLIDDSGLVITNSHVIKEAGDDVRVRFGQNIVLKGDILVQDRENDIAIVYVNLENVKDYNVLEYFKPETTEDLVIIGEKIIAIGSPINRESLEKTVTEGIISKYENNIIYHDAAINCGNSGGPLFNFDGQVVGINTFMTANNIGQNIAGAVPIYKALATYKSVKDNFKDYEKPCADLLPDVPRVSYPYADLMKEDDKFFKEYKKRKIVFKNKGFIFAVTTPPLQYCQLKERENKELERRKKRAKKKGFEVTDDEYQSKNHFQYYDYTRPVVTISVSAIPKLTKGSKAKKIFSFIGASVVTLGTLGVGAPLLATPFVVGNQREFKQDFYQMKLVDKEGNVLMPFSTGRSPISEAFYIFGDKLFQMVRDKSYIGRYEYDPEYFNTNENLSIVVKGEGDQEEEMIVTIPQEINKYVKKDFQVYWNKLAQEKKAKEQNNPQTNILAEIIKRNSSGYEEPEEKNFVYQETEELATLNNSDNLSDLDSIITQLERQTFNQTSERLPVEDRLSLLELHYFNSQLNNLSKESRIKAIKNKIQTLNK